MDRKQIASAFKVLGGKERIEIILYLSSGEKCVCRIFEHLKLPQNLASYHLSVLRRAKLIMGRKTGKWVHYSLRKESFEHLGAFLNGLKKRK